MIDFFKGIKKRIDPILKNYKSQYANRYNYDYDYECKVNDEKIYNKFIMENILSYVNSHLSLFDLKEQIKNSVLYTNDEQPTQVLTYDAYLEETNEYIFTKISGDIISCPGKYILTYGDIANSINKKYPTLSNISIVINKDVKNIKNIFDKFDILNFHND
jgi:ssRNA-specific RNase YbeY (16S rRNA maturation enzyme)